MVQSTFDQLPNQLIEDANRFEVAPEDSFCTYGARAMPPYVPGTASKATVGNFTVVVNARHRCLSWVPRCLTPDIC